MKKSDPRNSKSIKQIEDCLDYYEIRIKRSCRDPKFVLEAAGFVVLTIYAVFTIFMYFANKKSADAATNAAKTAEQTMLLDQRAWIAVTAVNSKEPPQVKKRFTYSIHFVDTGKTPASNVIVHAGDELLDKGQQPHFAVDTPVRVGVLSPGSERTFENGPVPVTRPINTMTEDDLAVLRAKTLSIHGKITYDDIFGCHHWITYCSVLKDDWSGFAFCSENNDTDTADQPCHSNQK